MLGWHIFRKGGGVCVLRFCSLHMAETASNLEDVSHLSAFHQIKGNIHAKMAAIEDLRLFSFGV